MLRPWVLATVARPPSLALRCGPAGLLGACTPPKEDWEWVVIDRVDEMEEKEKEKESEEVVKEKETEKEKAKDKSKQKETRKRKFDSSRNIAS